MIGGNINRKAYSLFLLCAVILPSILMIVLLSADGMAFAEDYDLELQDVMGSKEAVIAGGSNAVEGNVPGLTVRVSGSGGGWYGDSMSINFNNDTTQTLKIKVPIGLRLVPLNTGVQTMYTAGSEVIEVPPGKSNFVIKAFCGEMNDSAPGTGNTFYSDGFADDQLMKVLKRVNKKKTFDSDAQDAVWNRTDNKDISDNEKAKDLAGGGKVSGGKAAAAGLVGGGVIGGGALLHNRLKGNGSSKSGGKKTDKTPKDGDSGDDDKVEPPEDSDEHPPLPEELGPEGKSSTKTDEDSTGPAEDGTQSSDEDGETKPVRYRDKDDGDSAEKGDAGKIEKASESAVSTVPLLDPKTGKPLPVNDDGLVRYGNEWLPPDVAAEKVKIDQQWHADRQKGQQKVEEFKNTLKQINEADPDARAKVEEYKETMHKLNKTSDPKARAELEQKLQKQRTDIDADDTARHVLELNNRLHQQSLEGNADYDFKATLKAEGRTDAAAAFDKAVHDAYREVDRALIDKLNEMGFRRGGRKFTLDDIEDIKEFRNKASTGTAGMDRDVGLNEDKMRDLLDKLNKTTPGSTEARELTKQLLAERAASKITVDIDQQAAFLRRELTATNSQLDKLRVELDKAPRGSAEADRINAEMERLSGRPAQLQQELNGVEARATRIKDAYITELQGKLDKAPTGSPEAQRLTRAIEDAKLRLAGRAEIDVSPSRWNDSTQKLYDRGFNDVTRTDPEKAFQLVTTGKHREAFQDMKVLKGDLADPRWADQTASVPRIKEIENNTLVEHGKLSRGQAIQETARGYAKDIATKVIPQLTQDSRVDPDKLDIVNRIQDTFKKIGTGEITPGQADGALRQAVPEIKDITMEKATRIIDANYESSMKFQRPGGGPEDSVTRLADTESGVTRGGSPDGSDVRAKGPERTDAGSSRLSKAFGRTSDIAVVDNYYKQHIAAGKSHEEALSLAVAQTGAGNVAQMSGAADPRISMAAGALLPGGMSNMLPDQAIENWTGTTYDAGKSGLQALRDSVSSGKIETRALDNFAENISKRSGTDPFKGIGQISQLAGEEMNRNDGGNLVSDMQNIYKTGAGSEVVNESMSGFQQEIANAKPGNRMVALQGLDHLAKSVSEVVVDPIYEAKSLANDAYNVVKYGVGDGYWGECWDNTSQVLHDTPLVGQVIKGYNEIATGLGDRGVVGFTEDMYVGGKQIAGETAEWVGDAAKSSYSYIKSFF